MFATGKNFIGATHVLSALHTNTFLFKKCEGISIFGIWNFSFNYSKYGKTFGDFPSERHFWEAVEALCFFPIPLSIHVPQFWASVAFPESETLTPKAKEIMQCIVEFFIEYICNRIGVLGVELSKENIALFLKTQHLDFLLSSTLSLKLPEGKKLYKPLKHILWGKKKKWRGFFLTFSIFRDAKLFYPEKKSIGISEIKNCLQHFSI